MLRLLLLAALCAGVRANDEGWSVACDFVMRAECSSFAANPLCGSDDSTYQNDCFFAQEHCVRPWLHKEHDGACGNPMTGTSASGQSVTFDLFCKSFQHIPCGDDQLSLCGSDGKTYENLCVFEKNKCNNYGLDIIHAGSCTN